MLLDRVQLCDDPYTHSLVVRTHDTQSLLVSTPVKTADWLQRKKKITDAAIYNGLSGVEKHIHRDYVVDRIPNSNRPPSCHPSNQTAPLSSYPVHLPLSPKIPSICRLLPEKRAQGGECFDKQMSEGRSFTTSNFRDSCCPFTMYQMDGGYNRQDRNTLGEVNRIHLFMYAFQKGCITCLTSFCNRAA